MGEVLRFPDRLSPPRLPIYRQAVDQLEDLAELLHDGDVCGHGELLNLLCRILVQHFGADHTLDLIDTANHLVVSMRGPGPRPAA